LQSSFTALSSDTTLDFPFIDNRFFQTYCCLKKIGLKLPA